MARLLAAAAAAFGLLAQGAAACGLGDKCYYVPVAGAEGSDPRTFLVCSPTCKCQMDAARPRQPRHVDCGNCSSPDVQGNPATCQGGVLACAASDRPAADKSGCMPRTWNISSVQTSWQWNDPDGAEQGMYDDYEGGARLRILSGDWGPAVTAFLRSHTADFMVDDKVVAKIRLEGLDQIKEKWEHPLFPEQDLTVDAVIFNQQFVIYDNFGGDDMNMAIINTNNYVVNEYIPCCFPGFCADKKCNTCTAADKMIPGSDLSRCRASSGEDVVI